MINSFTTVEPSFGCECGEDHVRFDEEQLREAQLIMSELQPTVATRETVTALRHDLADIALGIVNRPVIITGPCHEPVGDLERAASSSIRRAQLMAGSALAGSLFIQRDRGQNTKPRSNAFELSPEGHLVAAFHGDAVNDRDWESRQPNTTRLLRAAAQASFVEMRLTEAFGHHMPAAHEFLNLAFEEPQMRDGFTSSADLPWVGVRNKDMSGEHFRMLSGVANPVGFKVSHEISDKQIREISHMMNPDFTPGKLVWMLRLGLSHMDEAPRIVSAISREALNSILLFDIHGSTRTNKNGKKIRCVNEIVEEIGQLASVCDENGARLNGVHLETTVDETRTECVDRPDEEPTHDGNIDPQLNPRQTMRVLDFLGETICQ